MRNVYASVAFALIAVLAADPALAQFNGGGDVPFQQGMSTVLNWAFVAGIAVALFSFILACVFLFMRNLIGFAGGVLGVLIGGALMANAATIVQGLTGLTSQF
ncbi:hypothetical protein JL101_036155 (plasmid) [Skermanella rosea]|uniref:hypothetical protein n=1 Tax=Skermanella rosea TaxID=1817965 RepID=UPI00193327E9|nr:hypothetical protein [Skermanella rosea]UEM08189.1 hypothetical protein JL101_036155 [Skermanella rosea]